ncbi:MAG: hypothetical protein AAF216_07180 [Pseudomonadota bacterium]
MTKRRISDTRPFTFQADFSSPAGEDPRDNKRAEDTASELAALGAKLQADAISKVRDPLDGLAAERLDHAIARLGDALDAFSTLADRLDDLARQQYVPGNLAAPARSAAKAISDGQGDLFALCQSLRAQSSGA